MKNFSNSIAWLLVWGLSLTAPVGIAGVTKFQTLSHELKAKTVYVTKTGKKYHLSNCSYLRSSKIAIDKDKAINEGYTACSRCKP